MSLRARLCAAWLSIAALLAADGVSAQPVSALASMWDATRAAARAAGISGHVRVADAATSYGEDFGPRPAKAGPYWRWASVTKQVIAVAAMQQVEAGKLALDVPIAGYVPELMIANADRITLRQLLQHTSGLPNVEDGALNSSGDMLVQYLRSSPKPAPGISTLCFGTAKAEPGARFEYNNCDTEIVGAILEKVSGQPLPKLLAARVFRPAGMTSTRLLRAGDNAGRSGYFSDGRADRDVDVGRFGAAGALAGSPADLARFDQALMGGRLLGETARAELWRGIPSLGYQALGQWSYTAALKGCAAPLALVERRGNIGGVEVRNIIVSSQQRILIVFTDRPTDFGEPWQGKGVTYSLMSAAFCPAAPR